MLKVQTEFSLFDSETETDEYVSPFISSSSTNRQGNDTTQESVKRPQITQQKVRLKLLQIIRPLYSGTMQHQNSQSLQ